MIAGKIVRVIEEQPSSPAERLVAGMSAIERAFLLGVEGVTEVLLVRHADVYQGLTDTRDPGLSELGHRQAELVGARLRAAGFDAVYASPLRRARQTAEHIIAGTGHQLVTDPRLQEIPVELGGEAMSVGGRAGPLAFTEPITSVMERMEAAVDAAVRAHPGRRVVMVSHAGAIVAYLSRVLRLGSTPLRLLPHYTSISTVRILDGRRMAGSLGDVAHLQELHPRL